MNRSVALLAGAALATCLLTASHGTARAQTSFFVDKDSIGGPCSDDGPGTETEPWCTISKANRTLTAGDRVTIRKGEYHESIAPENDGEERNLIRYYGEQPYGYFTTVLAEIGTALRIVGRSYVLVDGVDAIRVDRFITLDNSHHIVIRNGWFGEHDNDGGWPMGVVFRNNSHHNQLLGNVITGVGYSTADDDKGGVMNLGNWQDADDNSDHNLIEGNDLFYAGHHVLAISSSYNVIRGNRFQNHAWMDCARAEIGGKCGNRNIIFEYDASHVAWNVVEHNWIEHSGVPPDQNTSAGLSVRTPHNIIRRNVFENNDGPGVDVSTLTGLWDARDNHIYHNVVVHNGYTALPGVEHWKQAGMLIAHHGQGAEIVDLGIKNNILHDNMTHGMMFYYTDREAQVVEGNWEEAGDPGFDDLDAPADPANPPLGYYWLRPDSPCIDQGAFLTETTVPGAGREIPVVDAGYLSDGREIVQPDEIQLEGTNETARIVSIDYESNVLTVDRDLLWTQGQGVSQPYAGSAPDIGWMEYVEPRPTSTPSPSPPWPSPSASPFWWPTSTPPVPSTPDVPLDEIVYLPLVSLG